MTMSSTADSVPVVITTGFKAFTNPESFFCGSNMTKGKLLHESGRVYDVKEVRFDGQVDVTERRTPQTKLSAPAKKFVGAEWTAVIICTFISESA